VILFAAPAIAVEEPGKERKPTQESAEMSAEVTGFSGLIVGRLVDKDVEKGTCSVKVDRIARLFNNNKAKHPKSLVGKTVALEGLQGQFLDRLLLMKKGETVQFGALAIEGARMRINELFRKVAPYDASDYPELPEGFRGFSGAVSGKVVKKDPAILQMIVKVTAVKDTWDGNQAKTPESIVGKSFVLSGFFQYREQFDKAKVGDEIEIGLKHPQPQSDHLNIDKFVRGADDRVAMKDKEMESSSGAERFNGMLVGRVISKDVEKGQFQVAVDRVSRVWRNSKADNPKSLVGKTVTVGGVTGKWLDVLLLVDKGETLEFECRHDGGDKMTFPGEMMRKVPPVKPGEYPELPEAFRGFHGAVAATVVKKDPEMLEMIVKATNVKDTWKKNRAEDPDSIVGKRFILAGFWQRREAYNDLKVGDNIEVGLEHISLRSDHLSITEFVRKAESKDD
jgi:hypothetical protein